jgi:hypothetical protein
MKRIHFFSIAIIFTLAGLGSCDIAPWDCVRGNDRIATEERIIGSFNSVASYGSYVVNVEEGSDYSLTVEADENLLPYIRTSIEGNTLILETKNGRCIRSREPIVIEVVTRNIDELKLAGSGVINADRFSADELNLKLSGSGDINCNRIDVDYVIASISGSGNIELSGNSKTADFNITGSGLMRAIDLQTERCYATITGSGNIYTRVIELLDIKISGSGNLYYDGDPEISEEITGSGSVRRY